MQQAEPQDARFIVGNIITDRFPRRIFFLKPENFFLCAHRLSISSVPSACHFLAMHESQATSEP